MCKRASARKKTSAGTREREKKRTQGQVHLSRSSLARQFIRAPPSPPPLLPHAASLLQSSTLTRPYFLLNLVQKRAKVKGKVCDPVTEEAEARRRDPLFTTRGPGGVSESGREDDTRGQDDTRTDVTCLPSSSCVSIYLTVSSLQLQPHPSISLAVS